MSVRNRLDHRAPLANATIVRFEEMVLEELIEAAAGADISLAELVRLIVDDWADARRK